METLLNRDPIVIVGGGLSGLAAALRLSSSHIPVLLLEQRPVLGGRASSFTDTSTGDVVDNGQHLLIAGYTRTLAFAEAVGSRHLLRVQEHPLLSFYRPGKGFAEFRIRRLPSPLHLIQTILTSSLFTGRERSDVLRAGIDILRATHTEHGPGEGKTVAEWLNQRRQPDGVRSAFWIPLAASIMNERIETASAALFLHALHVAFLGHWHHAALVFPEAGLSRIFAEPAAEVITNRGGMIRCNADVRTLEMDGGTVRNVCLRDGTTVPCRSVILAVPQNRAVELYPPACVRPVGVEEGLVANVSPIVSMHLWFDDPFMDRDAVGLIGRTVHWVFRKNTHVSVVISAAHDLVERSREELVRLAVEDLREVFGRGVGQPRHALVIREKRATVSLTPDSARRRPGAATAVQNLFLAGDWTNTGLPATIEGAILSGENAAELALKRG
ncbi:MAG TPA: hydroxysqualene dehydroxylase HpnE [Bacteroidota bacterium]|nr:hydroxysqualene dehydroxylase HpnE [Bacteroidota bacterium]